MSSRNRLAELRRRSADCEINPLVDEPPSSPLFRAVDDVHRRVQSVCLQNDHSVGSDKAQTQTPTAARRTLAQCAADARTLHATALRDHTLTDSQRRALIASIDVTRRLAHKRCVAIREADEKRHAVASLEHDVQQLRELMIDFAVVVQTQGDMLDNIEQHVLHASDYVEQGRHNLEEAVMLERRLRRKQCCLATVALVVLLIAGAIVYGTVVRR